MYTYFCSIYEMYGTRGAVHSADRGGQCAAASVQCGYILNSVLFQTKSGLVWKSNSKNVVTNFQTKPSLVWKLKMLSQISKPNSVWFGNFLCRICGGNKFQTKSSFVWKFSKLILVWFGNIIFQLKFFLQFNIF